VLLNPGLTASQLDAGMHTGKEGTEAMPYFDTFDLETIDILLISQYVLPFPCKIQVDEELGDRMSNYICFTNVEDKQDHSERRQSFYENCSNCPLGHRNSFNCIIRAENQYKSVHTFTLSVR
jgi:hypothetical protein